MPFTRWWHSFLISFSVVTWGLAQPIYNVIGNAGVATDALPSVMLLVLVYHVVPTALLFLIDRAIIWRWGAGRALRVYRTSLFAVAALVFLRALQLSYLSQVTSLAEVAKIGLIIGLTLAVVGLVMFAFRAVTRLFIYLAAASMILTGVFVFQIATRSTARDWSPPGETSPAQGTAALPHPPNPLSVYGKGAGDEVQKDPIFIVIFDALGGHFLLKDGQIDAERFPHFAALGRDSAVFTNATTNYNYTRMSIPSFLRGQWVAPEAPLPSPSYIAPGSLNGSVLSVLGQNGYQIELYDEGFPPLGNRTKSFVLEASFLYYRLIVPRPLRQLFYPLVRAHPFTLLLWDDFLKDISASRSPGRVYFMHLILPHEPFEFDRYGHRRPAPPPQDAAQMEQSYEEQVMLADSLLGRLTDKLKAEGLYERSVIVVTGDHGPNPLDPLLSRLPQELHALSPSVGMIIHAPRVRPQVSDVDYQHIDFRPTLWEALGGMPEKGLPGVSAFAPERPGRDKWFWNNWLTNPEDSPLGLSEKRLPFSRGWFKYDQTTGWWRLSPSGPP